MAFAIGEELEFLDLPKSERFEGYWENTKEKCRLNRIYLLFDDEDPRIFSKRFKQAY